MDAFSSKPCRNEDGAVAAATVSTDAVSITVAGDCAAAASCCDEEVGETKPRQRPAARLLVGANADDDEPNTNTNTQDSPRNWNIM